MRLILLGCPGAGKGTQAKIIAARLHIPQISTGDILRTAIQQGSALGNEVKSIVESGQLVPDELVIQLVDERLKQSDCQDGFLLDGFPRTITQAQTLQTKTAIDYVIDIDVPEEELVKRLSGRRIHPGSGRTYHMYYQPPKVVDIDDVSGEPLIQRPDDSEEAVRKRLSVYHSQTKPLQDYYQQQSEQKKFPHYQKIDGSGSISDITARIYQVLHIAPSSDARDVIA